MFNKLKTLSDKNEDLAEIKLEYNEKLIEYDIKVIENFNKIENTPRPEIVKNMTQKDSTSEIYHSTELRHLSKIQHHANIKKIDNFILMISLLKSPYKINDKILKYFNKNIDILNTQDIIYLSTQISTTPSQKYSSRSNQIRNKIIETYFSKLIPNKNSLEEIISLSYLHSSAYGTNKVLKIYAIDNLRAFNITEISYLIKKIKPTSSQNYDTSYDNTRVTLVKNYFELLKNGPIYDMLDFLSITHQEYIKNGLLHTYYKVNKELLTFDQVQALIDQIEITNSQNHSMSNNQVIASIVTDYITLNIDKTEPKKTIVNFIKNSENPYTHNKFIKLYMLKHIENFTLEEVKDWLTSLSKTPSSNYDTSLENVKEKIINTWLELKLEQ